MAEAKHMTLLGQNDLGKQGDGMHVNVVGGHAFVAHQGLTAIGTSILDVNDPTQPRVIAQIERPAGTRSHKIQVVGDVMVVNHERNKDGSDNSHWSAGLAIYDVSTPAKPKQVGFFQTPGVGVHRMTYWEEPYAFVSGTAEGFLERILYILDLSDPSAPREVGRWWMPGQNLGAGESPSWNPPVGNFPVQGEKEVTMHHGLPDGDRLYCGWWGGGYAILDISDMEAPFLISRFEFDPAGSEAHTALPLKGRNLLVVTDEAVERKLGVQKHVRVMDISDETNPQLVSTFPVPESDYLERGIRFGPHNVHEHKPGSLLDPNTVYLTYFAGGLRVYDVTQADQPEEIAFMVPDTPFRVEGAPASSQVAAQYNDVTVDSDGLVYVTDRFGGGLYIIEHHRSEP